MGLLIKFSFFFVFLKIHLLGELQRTSQKRRGTLKTAVAWRSTVVLRVFLEFCEASFSQWLRVSIEQMHT